MSNTGKKFVLPIVVLVLLFCAAALPGGGDVKSVAIGLHIPDFKALTYPAGDQQVDGFVNSYFSQINNLIQQLETGRLSGEQQTYVIYVLGQLRASHASTALVEIIDFEAPKTDPKFKIARWGRYPAMEALVDIGRPAVNEILAKASRPQSESRLKQMAEVIHDVEGGKFGKLILEGSIAKAPTEEAGNNLRALLKHFDDLRALLKESGPE
jgi:hypothetical protein